MNKIDTLIAVDMKSLADSLNAKNPHRIRMKDGTKPTQEQYQHIMRAGPDDFDAAQAELEARLVRAENAIFAPKRIADLMDKYNAAPGEPLGEVAERMTEDDQRELKWCVSWLQTERKDDGDRHA